LRASHVAPDRRRRSASVGVRAQPRRQFQTQSSHGRLPQTRVSFSVTTAIIVSRPRRVDPARSTRIVRRVRSHRTSARKVRRHRRGRRRAKSTLVRVRIVQPGLGRTRRPRCANCVRPVRIHRQSVQRRPKRVSRARPVKRPSWVRERVHKIFANTNGAEAQR
jgi:hypothetical protein